MMQRFAAQFFFIINAETIALLHIFVENVILFCRMVLWIELKKQHLFEI